MEYINELDGKGFGSSWIAPSFPLPTGARWEALCFHTDETGPNNTIEQAIQTLKWQAGAGSYTGGSYHFYTGRKQDGNWAAVRGVRADRAAGGISTRRDSIWAPHRYPELAKHLSPAAYADPNSRIMHVMISGQTKLLTSALPAGLARALAELVLDFEKGRLTPASGTGSLNLGVWGAFLCGHFQWQTNRTDPGQLLLPAIQAEYDRLVAPAPVPVPVPTPPAINWQAIAEKRGQIITSKNIAMDTAINALQKGKAISE